MALSYTYSFILKTYLKNKIAAVWLFLISTFKFGYVSFPSKINCKPDKRASSIYLSTMLAAIGFRPKLIEYFVEHYSELGIANTNMLFTIQIDEDVSHDILFRIGSILKAKGL